MCVYIYIYVCVCVCVYLYLIEKLYKPLFVYYKFI